VPAAESVTKRRSLTGRRVRSLVERIVPTRIFPSACMASTPSLSVTKPPYWTTRNLLSVVPSALRFANLSMIWFRLGKALPRACSKIAVVLRVPFEFKRVRVSMDWRNVSLTDGPVRIFPSACTATAQPRIPLGGRNVSLVSTLPSGLSRATEERRSPLTLLNGPVMRILPSASNNAPSIAPPRVPDASARIQSHNPSSHRAIELLECTRDD